MKKILIIIMLLFAFNANSQGWAQPGATWFYEYIPVYASTPLQPYSYQYNGDTLLNGHLCQKFCEVHYSNNGLDSSFTDIGYTYSSGDTVFYWKQNKFYMLFDFGAQVGDSWIIADTIYSDYSNNLYCSDTSRVIVTFVGVENINGINCRTITLDTDSNSVYFLFGKYYEHFGRLFNYSSVPEITFIFPGPNYYWCNGIIIDNYYHQKFDCYHDNNFYLNPSGDCGYTIGLTDKVTPNIKIYPNPTKNIFYIKNIDRLNQLKCSISNVLGENILYKTLNNQTTAIDISNLPKGVYFINIYDNNNLIKTEKITKI